MSHNDLGSYLKNCRDRLSPDAIGFTATNQRRTPGLRREEVALLANVSVDYYARLEQGRASKPSPEVVSALARALRLDRDESGHLHRLAGLNPITQDSRHVRPGIIELMTALSGSAAAFVLDANDDILAWNELAAALLVDFGEIRRPNRNMVWLLLFHEPLRSRIPVADLQELVDRTAADFVARSIQSVDEDRTKALLEEFETSAEFSYAAATDAVGEFRSCVDHIVHPTVGDVICNVELLDIAGTAQRLVIYTQSPDSEATLRLLSVIGAQGFDEEGKADAHDDDAEAAR